MSCFQKPNQFGLIRRLWLRMLVLPRLKILYTVYRCSVFRSVQMSSNFVYHNHKFDHVNLATKFTNDSPFKINFSAWSTCWNQSPRKANKIFFYTIFDDAIGQWPKTKHRNCNTKQAIFVWLWIRQCKH